MNWEIKDESEWQNKKKSEQERKSYKMSKNSWKSSKSRYGDSSESDINRYIIILHIDNWKRDKPISLRRRVQHLPFKKKIIIECIRLLYTMFILFQRFHISLIAICNPLMNTRTSLPKNEVTSSSWLLILLWYVVVTFYKFLSSCFFSWTKWKDCFCAHTHKPWQVIHLLIWCFWEGKKKKK